MRIPSGVTDQFIYFVAVDPTDLKTRETGLTGFTVYRSRDGAAAVAYTTPTVNETDTTNMPGVYELLVDEDMTIAAGNDSEEVCLHITQASMAPVTRVFELYRRTVTAGNTHTVDATGNGAADVTEWLGTAPATPTVAGVPEVDLTHWLGTAAATPTVAGVPEVDLTHVAGSTSSVSPLATNVAAILVDTGTTLDAALAVVDANVDAILVDTAEIGVAGAGLTNINLPNQTMDIVGNITGNLSGSVGSVTGAVGSVTGLTAANLDVAVSTRLASASYTTPDNAGIAAIQAKTDQLTFFVANRVDVNVLLMNSAAVLGNGTAGDLWRG